jgi:hypothetical protein
MQDKSSVEDPKKLAVETIQAARRIAQSGLTNVRVLWIDDHPPNNEIEVGDIKSKLSQIVPRVVQSPNVWQGLELVRQQQFNLIIANYGKDRCDREGKLTAIAICVLDGVKALSSPPPVLIYSAGTTSETADIMKCRGAVTQTDDPDLLLGWIVRALDPEFIPSRSFRGDSPARLAARCRELGFRSDAG